MGEITTIMVIGAGQMGSGIAQVAAHAGLTVLLHDLEEKQLQKSVVAISDSLTRQLTSTAMGEEQRQAILARILPTTHFQDCVRADFIVEAATENITIKKQIFQLLCEYTTAHSVLATNTSSLSITEIATATDCPERVIGMHFMNPVPIMALVEVVRGIRTSDETCIISKALAQTLGKEPIEVNDYPGFVSNRLLMPMINEAIFCVFDGIADVESVDRIMQLGLHHPMGPLALADLIGLDTCLSIMEILHRGFADSKYRPCPMLRNMVKAGKLGKKSGEGFYTYDA